jgi:predicted dehydrogenase
LEKAEAWAKAHEVPKAFGSYEELLACADVQAVYIPLPTGVRKEWVIKVRPLPQHAAPCC